MFWHPVEQQLSQEVLGVIPNTKCPYLPAARKLKSSTVSLTGVILTSELRWRLVLFRRSDNSSLNLPDVWTTFRSACISFVGFSHDPLVTSLRCFPLSKSCLYSSQNFMFTVITEKKGEHMLRSCPITRMIRMCTDCYLWSRLKCLLTGRRKTDVGRSRHSAAEMHTWLHLRKQNTDIWTSKTYICCNVFNDLCLFPCSFGDYTKFSPD